MFANFVAGFRTTFVRVSQKYLENFHVSRTSRELVAKFLNRFKTFMQMFSSKYFGRLSRDCRNNENENKPYSRESRETLSRMSCDCRATVAMYIFKIRPKFANLSHKYPFNENAT